MQPIIRKSESLAKHSQTEGSRVPASTSGAVPISASVPASTSASAPVAASAPTPAPASNIPAGRTPKSKDSLWAYLVKNRFLYMLLIPVAAYLILFKYAPIFGEVIAFKNYRLSEGIWDSAWVGFDQFEKLFQSREFYTVLRNTLLLNLYNLVFAFPAPILLALLLNEVRSEGYKRVLQNLLYIPHFISWVVLGSIIIALLSPSTGYVNYLLKGLGLEPIFFLADKTWWPITFIGSSIWKEAGFGTILYLAAMSSIDPTLYEAAKIYGASKRRQIWHVTLPGIRSTIAILLILQVGKMMDVGFEQVYALRNPAVTSVAEVISTFVYTRGIVNLQYSYTAALGLFQSLIALILVVTVNQVIKKMGERGLW